MHTELRRFLSQLAAAVLLALAVVTFTAFVSIPYTLERYPGEPASGSSPHRHMT